MNLTFKPMLQTDVSWVAARERELDESPWSEGNFADSLDAGYSCWLVLENEAPVGYAIVMVVLDEAHLLKISVALSHQRKGIGGALLGHLAGVARQAGAQQMFLEVRTSNLPAQVLYRRAGFHPIARRKGYYPGPRGREDAVVMRLPL